MYPSLQLGLETCAICRRSVIPISMHPILDISFSKQKFPSCESFLVGKPMPLCDHGIFSKISAHLDLKILELEFTSKPPPSSKHRISNLFIYHKFLGSISNLQLFWLVNSTIKWCQNHRLPSPDPLMDILGMILGFTMWTSPPSPPVPSVNLWMLPQPGYFNSTYPNLSNHPPAFPSATPFPIHLHQMIDKSSSIPLNLDIVKPPLNQHFASSWIQ